MHCYVQTLNIGAKIHIRRVAQAKNAKKIIAASIGVSESTISREIRRNGGIRGGYGWRRAQELSDMRKDPQQDRHRAQADGCRFGDWEMDTIIGANGREPYSPWWKGPPTTC